MKIDLVIPALNLGGSERQLTGLAIGLHEADHDVNVITLRSGGVLESELSSHGVRIVSLESKSHDGGSRKGLRERTRHPQAMNALIQHWRYRRPDAIQAWLPEAQIIALPVAAALRIHHRIMALRSMSEPVNLTAARRLLVGGAARCSTLVTANAQAILDDPGWPIAALPHRVITNAVSMPPASATPSTQPAQGIVVANLTPIKGHELLLQALTLMDKPPRLTLVGSGPEFSALTRGITELRLDGVVTIVQDVTDPIPLLTASQFFILPSPSEGLPDAVLEAMAAGLPVVAFAVGGIPELVENGETGLLVEPGDVPGLARAIDKIAGDPTWRAQAGAKARERARDFSWECVVRKNLDAMAPAKSGKKKRKSGESRGNR